jgi:hypothetical protein
MDVVEEARAALEEYKRTKVLPRIPMEPPDDFGKVRYDVWQCVFEDHLEVWEHIALIEERRCASWALGGLVKSLASANTDRQREATYGITAALCHTKIASYAQHNLDGGTFPTVAIKRRWKRLFKKTQAQVAAIWLDTFKGHPGLLNALREDNNSHRKFWPALAKIIDKLLGD